MIEEQTEQGLETGDSNFAMKYLLGTAIQAASRGKIGVVVCWNNSKKRSLMGIRETLSLLNENGKNAFCTGNLLILSKDTDGQAVYRSIVQTETSRPHAWTLPDNQTDRLLPCPSFCLQTVRLTDHN